MNELTAPIGAEPEVFLFSDLPPILSSKKTANPSVQKMLYDRRTAAFVLSISVRNLDARVANKELNTMKVGGRVLIPHGELVRFSKSHHSTTTHRDSQVSRT